MEGCPHCHDVLENVLPPLEEQFGSQLQITLVEVSSSENINRLYDIAEHYGIPKEQVGVPFLIIGDQVLLGSGQIRSQLPGLIKRYLTQGGVDLPEYPEIALLLPEQSELEESCPPTTPLECNEPYVTEEGENDKEEDCPSPPCGTPAETGKPAVIGVLFTTPDCPECQIIVEQVRSLARDTYQGQFELDTLEIVTSKDVTYLYQVAAHFGLSQDEVDLPLFIVGSQVLVKEDIPEQLPALIETTLQEGGAETVSLPTPVAETSSTPNPARPEGYWIAIGTMGFMIAALLYSIIRIILALLRAQFPGTIPAWQTWAIPLLALVGLGVAGYLAYVETQLVEAVCGPVGDCNSVQSSPYARLFGVLPIGILGMGGYMAILAAWAWGHSRQDAWADNAPLAIFGVSFIGVLFSLYLTYLEPFVIRAVCMWCISSAVVITLLLLFSLQHMLVVLNLVEEYDSL